MKIIKTILTTASLIILSGCATSNINENKEVKAEIYLIHTSMKAYEVITEEDRRDWKESLTIEEIIKELPVDSNATLIYKTEISSNWGKVAEKEEYDFITNTWEIKNKENLKAAMDNEKFKNSSFMFKIKPLYFTDGRAVAEMRYNMKFLTAIESYEEDGKKVYYPIEESFQDSKSIGFLPNKYYVFSTIPLKDKSSFIIIYKLKN